METYSIVSDYMKYYNQRRKHGSIKFMAPNMFYEAFIIGVAKIKPFST